MAVAAEEMPPAFTLADENGDEVSRFELDRKDVIVRVHWPRVEKAEA
jgi:hypothetical protein